ncbi:hypothetical protein Btru_025717 [Bulinus truncatus]|nr:hypothetical protein Btru_025717 [Bulinus truncatus]
MFCTVTLISGKKGQGRVALCGLSDGWSHRAWASSAAMDNHNHHMDMATTTMGPHNQPMDHMNHDHHSMMDHGMDMNGTMDMMQMYFHAGYQAYVLFQSCYTNSPGAMVGACFVIFFVAVLYEGLKYLREVLLQRSLAPSSSYVETKLPSGSSTENMVMHVNTSVMNRMLSSSHFIQTFLHIIQVFVSYCLMLVFMTYNVWLCIAVILGAGVGYFLFGWRRAVVVDSNEHCH